MSQPLSWLPSSVVRVLRLKACAYPSHSKVYMMSKKPTGVAAGNSEALRIYEKMEEERKRKEHAKAEANKPKKVTLPRLKFMEDK